MKQILRGSEAREAIKKGLHLACDTVASTLGPQGLNAVIYRGMGLAPISSRDGVTVCRNIDSDDHILNVGIELAKNISNKTAQDVGDSTTSVLVLLDSIYTQGLEALKNGANARALKRGIDLAISAVTERLNKLATPVYGDRIFNVATISANNDKVVGKVIADAVRSAGRDGVITVEEGNNLTTTLDHTEGLEFSSGYVSPYFINTPRQECVLENPYILVYEKKLGSMKAFMPLLEQLVRTKRPFFVIAEAIEGEVTPLLVTNNIQSLISCCAVNCPYVGNIKKDFLTDIGILTGGQAVIDELGIPLESIKLADLGQAAKVIVTRNKTTILQGKGNPQLIAERIEQIRTQLETTTDEFQKDKLNERLAKLSGGVSIIRVGGASRIELEDTKMRIEDSLLATRAAISEGIVAGGGVTLLRCQDALENLTDNPSEQIGVDVVKKALFAPLTRIASNAGLAPQEVIERILANDDISFGLNALTQEYGNLVEMGVLDPVKVVRTAIENAGSVAGQLLITESVLVNVNERKA